MWTRSGYSPVSFWDQCQATFAAALRGAEERAEAERDLALFGAWQSARLHRTEKLKGFQYYWKQMRRKQPGEGRRQTPSEMLAAWHALAAAGAPIRIRKLK